MGPSTSNVKRKFLIVGLALAGFLVIAYSPLNRAFGADPVKQQPSAQLAGLGMKFEGAAGCNAAKCHGSPTANPAPKPAGNEFVTWSEKDKHAEAYKALAKPEGQKIADALKLGKATESSACLNCHGLEVPANLWMDKFNVKEGITCGACHGPYEKWEKPHNQPGGADGLRTAAGYKVLKAEEMPYSTSSPEHQKMLKDYGLYDTRPILARAEKCASCHLAIDAKLIDAGHPTPFFELAYFTDVEPPHWREPGGYWGTKVWAAGQVVCLRDAMNQLAERAADAATPAKQLAAAQSQALAHLLMFRHLVGPKAAAALNAAAADIKGAGADKAKLAAAAKSAAATASSLMESIAALAPNEGKTSVLLTKIATDTDALKDAGFHGAQQQALSLSSLVASMKKGKGALAGIDELQKLIDEKLLAAAGDEAAFKPADFAADVKNAAGKIMMMLPSGAGVPDPIDLK